MNANFCTFGFGSLCYEHVSVSTKRLSTHPISTPSLCEGHRGVEFVIIFDRRNTALLKNS